MTKKSRKKSVLHVGLAAALALVMAPGCQEQKAAPLKAPAVPESTALPAGFGMAPKPTTPPTKNQTKKPAKKDKKKKTAPKKPAEN